jgi:hypothetical protein
MTGGSGKIGIDANVYLVLKERMAEKVYGVMRRKTLKQKKKFKTLER